MYENMSEYDSDIVFERVKNPSDKSGFISYAKQIGPKLNNGSMVLNAAGEGLIAIGNNKNSLKYFGKLGRGARNTGTGGAVASIVYDTWQLSHGDINAGRYSYHLGATGMSMYTASLSGGLPGVCVGGTAMTAEMMYDNIKKYLTHLADGLGSISYNIKKGWNPDKMFY
jgi:hypothetical protein